MHLINDVERSYFHRHTADSKAVPHALTAATADLLKHHSFIKKKVTLCLQHCFIPKVPRAAERHGHLGLKGPNS